MMPFKCIGPLFLANIDDAYRIYVNQGGTSSGKTYTIMQVLFYHAMMEPNAVITVCGQDWPNLKVGAYRDAKTIMSGSEWMQDYFKINESSHFITGNNGSVIEFNSYQGEQDAKNGKRDYLFVNEANGVMYDIYWQLAIRTRKKIFIDYNPSAKFWAHEKLIGREETKLIISDHRGNPFLSKEEHNRIESIDDKELWRVYARGLTGKLTGTVFSNWDIVDKMPERSEMKLHGYGLDFGFSSDPTALVEFAYAHGEIYLNEKIYKIGLTNQMIAIDAREEGLTRSDIIVADSAEPKSIKELKNDGLNVIPALKGNDSIRAGIDILKTYKIHVTRSSVGLIEELNSYKFKKDRDGKQTNEPIDKWNHAIDASRYFAVRMLATRRRGVAKAHYQELG